MSADSVAEATATSVPTAIAAKRPVVLRTVGLTKVYRRGSGEVHALRGLDVSIHRGEMTFILGRSGSGKSTLLHIMGALDRPTAGTVWLGDTDLGALTNQERATVRRDRLGFIFQSFHLLDTLDALTNVLIARIPQGITGADRERARALLAQVGLTQRKTHKPSELSGGEQQRVAIARALLADPPLILADEPTGELDSQTGREIMDLMRSAVNDHGKTFVIVTHDDHFIEPGDRVIRMADGRLLSDSYEATR